MYTKKPHFINSLSRYKNLHWTVMQGKTVKPGAFNIHFTQNWEKWKQIQRLEIFTVNNHLGKVCTAIHIQM